MFADAMAKFTVHLGDAGFAVELDEAVALGHDFELALDHGLVTNEGPVQIVRERHVAARFPVTDGLRFPEFAAESGFRADVEPESEIRAQGHGVEAAHVISID